MRRLFAFLFALAPIVAAGQEALLLPYENGVPLSAPAATRLAYLETSPEVMTIELVRVRPDALDAAAIRVNEKLVLERDRLEPRATGSVSWFSKRTGDTQGHFVVRGPRVTGSIRAPGVLYELRPLADDLHALIRLDPRSLPAPHPPSQDTRESPVFSVRPASPSPVTALGGDAIIGVVVAYTAQTAAEVGDVPALAQLAVDQTNESYRNAGIHAQLDLRHVYLTPTVSTLDMGLDLLRLRTGHDGAFDEVHALRYPYDGDVVVLLGPSTTSGYGSCGLASVGATHQSESFAVVAHNCATVSFTFAHEVGHLQGARHNPEVDGGLVPYPYGHGLTDTVNGFRTIMAYNSSSCPNGWCEKLLTWSSPDGLYQGVPTGDAARRNNARVLNETARLMESLVERGPAPALQLSRDAVEVALPPGEQVELSLDVTNVGGSTFEWGVETNGDVVLPTPGGGDPTERGRDGYGWRASNRDDLPFSWVTPPTWETSTRNDGARIIFWHFPIPLFGHEYRDAFADSRGAILMGPPPFSVRMPPVNRGFPVAAESLAVLAPFWDDLVRQETSTLQYGSTQDSLFVVQWNDFTHRLHGGSYTFQAVMGHDGVMQYNYRSMEGVRTSATIGLQGTDGQKWLTVALNEPFVQDSLTIQIEPSVPWLTVVGEPHDLDPGETQTVQIRLDARPLRSGTYSGVLSIRSPEPAVRAVSVPVSLSVGRATAAEEAPLPEASLGIPFPNPAHEETHVTLTLHAPGAVSVTVLDVTGRVIARLADGAYPAGDHLLAWDTSTAAAGMYVIRLTTETSVHARRVVVTR